MNLRYCFLVYCLYALCKIELGDWNRKLKEKDVGKGQRKNLENLF